jgi:hypothetical protein
MRRRLTKEEREIRRGSGIPFSRWWPVVPIFLAILVISTERQLFIDCIGNPIDGRSRFAAVVRAVAGVGCSPLLLRGSPADWLVLTALWIPVPFAVRNWRWAKRSKAYWDPIRQRQNERRKQLRAERRAAKSEEKERS